MQCKKCGASDLEQGFEEIFEGKIRKTFIESGFRCRTCGAMHLIEIDWADYDCHPLSKHEVALP